MSYGLIKYTKYTKTRIIELNFYISKPTSSQLCAFVKVCSTRSILDLFCRLALCLGWRIVRGMEDARTSVVNYSSWETFCQNNFNYGMMRAVVGRVWCVGIYKIFIVGCVIGVFLMRRTLKTLFKLDDFNKFFHIFFVKIQIKKLQNRWKNAICI